MNSYAYRLAETNKEIEKLRELCHSQESRLKLVEQLVLNLPVEKKKIVLTEVSVNLPDHLRKTYDTLKKLACATAYQIAGITKRARAVESLYLNQLCVFDIAEKKREGRKTFFSLMTENNLPLMETTA